MNNPMKMVLLMYLEDDEAAVDRMLEEHRVTAFSRVNLEGHGKGQPAGWYGQVAPYRSRMVFTLLPEERAAELLEAVAKCSECLDPRHPIHAVLLAVEDTADSGIPSRPASA
ncbi:MAG: hypothetical protein PVI57_16415 [Gemmatimonadota bacterium]|jgi:hypothetical protein